MTVIDGPAPGPPDVASLNPNQRARRARIVDAALAMMLQQEHSAIQMKAVSAAAGVALGTTYRYFPSKDQLLAEALAAWADRFPDVRSRLPGGRSVDQLKAVYRLVVRAFEPHPTVYGTLTWLEASGDPVVARTFARFAERTRTAFTDAIPRVSSPRRENLVMVMSSVLDDQLRHWALGLTPIDAVYRSLDVTAELLLGD
jgi:AcrR family transcriptional regulator